MHHAGGSARSSRTNCAWRSSGGPLVEVVADRVGADDLHVFQAMLLTSAVAREVLRPPEDCSTCPTPLVAVSKHNRRDDE